MSEIVIQFRKRLTDTIAWCRPRFSVCPEADKLRSHELGPPPNLVFESDDITADVQAVVAKREELLGHSSLLIESLPPGDRILASFPKDSLFHGTSPPECNGFIDEAEIPPWDTWVMTIEDMLLSWVPASMTAGVDSAIRCNAEESIQWASQQPLPCVHELQKEGLLR